jgi:hypothetical protein
MFKYEKLFEIYQGTFVNVSTQPLNRNEYQNYFLG